MKQIRKLTYLGLMLTLRLSCCSLLNCVKHCPNLVPPCQLGQLPNSRISYGYPGPRAQNPQQTGAPCTNPSRLQNSKTPLHNPREPSKIKIPRRIIPAFVNLLPSYPSFTTLSPHLLPYLHIVNAPYPIIYYFILSYLLSYLIPY